MVAVGWRQLAVFDLHSLVPVPWSILRLDDNHPDALDWLWANWGTTWTLRRVEERPLPDQLQARLQPSEAGVVLEFWSRRLDALASDRGSSSPLAGAAPRPIRQG